ncbi:MAG: hypothetical protein ACK4UO_16720 [Pseudolabrys sp.]
MPVAVVLSSKIAERLRAHARLCRQVAEECWSEEIAANLCKLADDCTQAAAAAEAELLPRPAGKPH